MQFGEGWLPERCEGRGDRLLGGLGRDHTGAAGHPLATVQLPAAQGDDLVANHPREADLRERPPLAADRDHRLAGGDDARLRAWPMPVATAWLQ